LKTEKKPYGEEKKKKFVGGVKTLEKKKGGKGAKKDRKVQGSFKEGLRTQHHAGGVEPRGGFDKTLKKTMGGGASKGTKTSGREKKKANKKGRANLT